MIKTMMDAAHTQVNRESTPDHDGKLAPAVQRFLTRYAKINDGEKHYGERHVLQLQMAMAEERKRRERRGVWMAVFNVTPDAFHLVDPTDVKYFQRAWAGPMALKKSSAMSPRSRKLIERMTDARVTVELGSQLAHETFKIFGDLRGVAHVNANPEVRHHG